MQMNNQFDFMLQHSTEEYSTGSKSTLNHCESVLKDIVIENIDENTSQTFQAMPVMLDGQFLQITMLLETLVRDYDLGKNIQSMQDIVDNSCQSMLKDKKVCLYDDLSNTFVNLGVEPYFKNDIEFTVQQFRNSNTLYFQVSGDVYGSQQEFQSIVKQEEQVESTCDTTTIQLNKGESMQQEKKIRKKRKMNPEKRVKERSIEEVRQKVFEWRIIQEREKINLDKAAKIIQISRKTLDDYSLQLRKAKEYGFNFLEHEKSKMGVLRKFNKQKEREAQEQKIQDSQKVEVKQEESNFNFEQQQILNNFEQNNNNVNNDGIEQYLNFDCNDQQQQQQEFQFQQFNNNNNDLFFNFVKQEDNDYCFDQQQQFNKFVSF